MNAHEKGHLLADALRVVAAIVINASLVLPTVGCGVPPDTARYLVNAQFVDAPESNELQSPTVVLYRIKTESGRWIWAGGELLNAKAVAFEQGIFDIATIGSPEAPVELDVTVTTPACEQKFTITAGSGGLEAEVGASQYELAVEPTEPIVVEQCPTTMDPDPLIRIDGCPDGSVAIGETVALSIEAPAEYSGAYSIYGCVRLGEHPIHVLEDDKDVTAETITFTPTAAGTILVYIISGADSEDVTTKMCAFSAE